MKKLTSILLLLCAFLFLFTACDGDGESPSSTSGNSTSTSSTPTSSTPASSQPASSTPSSSAPNGSEQKPTDYKALYEYRIENGEVCITMYKGTDSAVVIPSVLEGYPVTAIGYRAFWFGSALTSITIPDSVISIGDEAFYCGALTSILVEENNTVYRSIDGNLYTKDGKTLIQYAIGKQDETFVIPDGVTSIGEMAFSCCYALTSITIPESVTNIGRDAFFACYKLVEVYNLSGLSITKSSYYDYGRIGLYALDVYTSLDTPSKQWVTDDGYIFYEDGNARYLLGYTGDKTDLMLPTNCSGKDYAIYQYAFYDSSSLTSITISEGVTSIGTEAFSYCDALTSITFGENSKLTSIGAEAFFNCSALTCVTFGENSALESIAEKAFWGCDALTSITIPEGVTSIGNNAFYECSALTCVTFGENSALESIAEKAFWSCDALTSITIPESVTSIGRDAFYACHKLVEVYNLSGLSITKGSDDYGEIGQYALDVYTSLDIPSKQWMTDDGYIFYEGGNARYLLGYTGDESDLTLPTNCNGKDYAIYQYAFYDSSSLTSITISEGVTSIGTEAFSYCDALTSITFGENSKLTSIGAEAFYYCSSLTSITIPESVTSIASSTFQLTRLIETENGVFYVDKWVIGSYGNVTNVALRQNTVGIADYAFNSRDVLTSVTIPESVTSIGYRAFRNCKALTSVTFADSSVWYRTKSHTDFVNQTSGTLTDVTDDATNAINLESTYAGWYWYKK